MEALLICPAARPAINALARETPLVAMPLMGQSLVEFWLCHLAQESVKSVWILADDRPERIENLIGQGVKWGLEARVIAELAELSPAQALLKYTPLMKDPLPNSRVAVLDHFPGLGQCPLFTGYAAWFRAVESWIPQARTPNRVRVREIQEGVWADLTARIAPSVEFEGPCWIGRNAVIESGCIIGPGAIVEDGVFVERDAVIVKSYVGPDTFVGRYTELMQGIAWGKTLVNWKTGAAVDVEDSLMLCALRPRKAGNNQKGWLSRLNDFHLRKAAPAQSG